MRKHAAVWPQSFRHAEGPLLILMSVSMRVVGCAGFPVCPGVHRLRLRRDVPASMSLGWFVLVRSVRAGRRAAASRPGTRLPMARSR